MGMLEHLVVTSTLPIPPDRPYYDIRIGVDAISIDLRVRTGGMYLH